MREEVVAAKPAMEVLMVKGYEKEEMVGETPPTTVKDEQEVPPEQEAEEVATP